jgi:hypothetical protein
VAWIKTIDERDADGALKRLYASSTGRLVLSPTFLKFTVLLPKSSWHISRFITLPCTHQEIFPRAQREMIAVVVSAANGCHY